MTPDFLIAPSTGLRKVSDHWFECRDGDESCRELFHRHYSYREYADGRTPKLFVGPGEKLVLMTERCDALFVWRKFISDTAQSGVNCAVFRNESSILSSQLIREAVDVAWRRWPGECLFTYVNSKKIRSTNPGACFKAAGWINRGRTKVNKLVILEKRP